MMAKDTITQLLEKVASGKVSVKDARVALEDAEPGTIISAALAPSGNSALTTFFFAWGIIWSLYWIGTMLYGLLNGSAWEQQQLTYHMAMGLSTLILMGIVYLKWVLPDTIIVKHSQNKYIPEHQKDWREYNW